jgi:hypothetical protein
MSDTFLAVTSISIMVAGLSLYLLLIKSILHSAMPLKEYMTDEA